jgi:hypothetical protein
MEISLSLLLPVLTAVVGVTSWNVSLQGRVNAHDALFEEREKQADDRHEDLKARLVRIETKLDRAATFSGDSRGNRG